MGMVAVVAFMIGSVLPSYATSRVAADSSWVLDLRHSQVQFQVPRLGFSQVTGRFDTFSMKVEMEEDDLSTMSVSAEIDVNSIDTGIERRDTHLRSDDFFDAEQHPVITFQSTAIQLHEPGHFEIIGALTMRGVTREVRFATQVLGETVWNGKKRMAFQATTTLDRTDYGVSWSRVTDRGGIIIGNDVTVVLSIELGEGDA
ncbi:MAG: YceI family protein [Rhodothermales bacterium]